MIVDAVVPVKSPSSGKTRLASLLGPAERAALVGAMLQDVVAALQAPALLRSVAVVSPDAELLDLARRSGATPFEEPPAAHGLNAALAAAIAGLVKAGAAAVLVVPGDLPQISRADVVALLAGVAPGTTSRSPLVRAVPAADGGTSALLLVPPQIVSPAFGPQSFGRHRSAAFAAAARFEAVNLASLAHDVNRPEDIERLLRDGPPSRSRTLLLRLQRMSRLARSETPGYDAGEEGREHDLRASHL